MSSSGHLLYVDALFLGDLPGQRRSFHPFAFRSRSGCFVLFFFIFSDCFLRWLFLFLRWFFFFRRLFFLFCSFLLRLTRLPVSCLILFCFMKRLIIFPFFPPSPNTHISRNTVPF